MSWREHVSDALDKAFGPIPQFVPGVFILLALAMLSVAGGAWNIFHLPYDGDRSILFMLAFTVYPGPYLFYGLFCFFLFHAHPWTLITRIFYATLTIFCASPFVALYRRLQQSNLSFAQQLDEALFDNFLVTIGLGIVSFAIMAGMIFAMKWLEYDSGE